MQWKVEKDYKGIITGYKLSEDVYIRREFCPFCDSERVCHFLYVKGECVENNSSGEPLLCIMKKHGETAYNRINAKKVIGKHKMSMEDAIDILKITCEDSTGRDCSISCEDCKEAHRIAVELLENEVIKNGQG